MKDYSELKEAATRIIEVQPAPGVPFAKMFAEFDSLATPEVVLELIAEIDRLNEEYDKAWRHDLNNKNNVQALAAEVISLSKDAARYRWLRDSKRFDDEDPLGQLACGETEGEDLLFDSDLDHAIDMYMVWIKDKDIK